MQTDVSEKDLEGLVSSLSQPSQAKPNQAPTEDEIPEKYKNKSVAEIVEMHRNAERELGRLGHALGEQRELVSVLASKIDAKRKSDLGEDDDPEPVKLTPEALLDDPEAILEKWLRSKQSKRASKDDEDRVAKLEQQIAAQQLSGKHPDYAEVSNSQEFMDWVKASPLRLMTAQAGASGNVQAAIAVLDEFKASKKSVKDSTQELNAAALERAGANTVDPGTSSGRKYSRRAIRALQMRNPSKYQELLPQIRSAYERGDVIDDV